MVIWKFWFFFKNTLLSWPFFSNFFIVFFKFFTLLSWLFFSKNEKISFFRLFLKNTILSCHFFLTFFHKKIHPALMPFFAQNCPKIFKIPFFVRNWGRYSDTNLHIFHSKIAWLGVAPNFSVFFLRVSARDRNSQKNTEKFGATPK